MNSPAQNYRDLSEDDIRAALKYCNPDVPRDEWARIGMAIKSEFGQAGFSLFEEWSKSSDKYREIDIRDTWKSIHGTGGVRIGTLIAEAMASGFRFDEAERKPISEAEIAARQAQREREDAEAKAKLDADRAEAAARAEKIWGDAVDAEDHPYLAKKQVRAFGLRIGTWRGAHNALLLPLRLIDGSLVSLQAIFENASPILKGRDRDYLYNGQKRGAFHMLGDKPSGSTPIILIGSGYATCASAHMATGYSTAAVFDDGNMRTVANMLRHEYPHAVIVMLADNDCWHADQAAPNSGLVSSKQAAQTAAAMIAVPKFRDTSSKPTDFNDLHVLEGLDAVRAQIQAALPKTEHANDNEPEIPLDSPINPYGYPHLSDKGAPLNTVENLEHMLDQYGITARYNQIRKSVEVTLPGRSYTLDNEANCSLAELTSVCARNRLPKSELGDYVKLIADRNAYNPVCDWINSNPWDGVSRIQKLLDTITTDGDAGLKDKLIYRWMISAIASVFKSFGYSSHGCLVFTGPQGTGKTSWFKRLIPESMGLFLEGATLDPEDKDSVILFASHWIVELGELDATFRKADIAKLKAFVTKSTDKLRRPYDRIDSQYQRRTVSCASVNDTRYLIDDTGNRRWWTVSVLAIDYQHEIDMQQLWAEVLTHYKRGEQWHLTKEENDALGELNTEHEAIDPVEEMIVAGFKWDEALRTSRMTASEVMIAIGFDKPNKAQATHASKVLQKLTGGKPKRSASSRYFEMPNKSPRAGRGYAGEDDDVRPF